MLGVVNVEEELDEKDEDVFGDMRELSSVGKSFLSPRQNVHTTMFVALSTSLIKIE